jgi:hypothetical protein
MKQTSRRAGIWINVGAGLFALTILWCLFALLVALYPNWDTFVPVDYSESWTAEFTVPYLKCDADELNATRVVPELHVPIDGGTNLIWCAPFQLAWNGMMDWVGVDIRLAGNEPGCVPYLNEPLVAKENLDSATYVTAAGPYTRDLISQMNADVQSLFGAGSFAPEPLPEADGQGRLAAFGYLRVNLPFQYAFQRTDEPLMFNGVPVAAFTVPFGEGSGTKEEYVRRQVHVYCPPEEDEFVVELLTRETDHHLVLARIAPEATLAETVAKVRGYLDTLPQEGLEPEQDLIVPLFNFDITRQYTELIGSPLAVENSAYSMVEKAEQNIRFQFDERGAILKSSARVVYFCAPSTPCIFDEPFLLMLRYKDSPQPYFAMWVDNAEILVKDK